MHTVDVTFRPGAKALLIALLNAIKEFNPTQSINLVFTPRGMEVDTVDRTLVFDGPL